MSREVELKYNPQLGVWYNPATWFETSKTPALPAPTAPADEFFAPGYDRVIDQQLEMGVYRKKMGYTVAALVVMLGLAVWWKRRVK